MVRSAGLLLYKVENSVLEVWIAHMGGPFWARKDNGGWSLPKGEYEDPEEPLAVALREFEEEIGVPAPAGDYEDLGQFKQPSGKVITAFALESSFRVQEVRSNTFELEWPRGSGQIKEFPEIDRAEWHPLEVAREKLVKGQLPILDALEEKLHSLGVVFESRRPEEPSLFDLS